MENLGRVFLRDELLDKLYRGGELAVDRVVDVHIGKLRQKIAETLLNPLISTLFKG